jgi:hypothetical protein
MTVYILIHKVINISKVFTIYQFSKGRDQKGYGYLLVCRLPLEAKVVCVQRYNWLNNGRSDGKEERRKHKYFKVINVISTKYCCHQSKI